MASSPTTAERHVGAARDAQPRPALWLAVSWGAAALPLVALRTLGVWYAWPPRTYVPVHALVELAIALVAFATFAVQWYAAGVRGASDARARFLGSAFLGVGLLHTLHLLVFPGMPGLFGPDTVERGIYYLLLGRVWLTGALLAAAFIAPASAHPLLGRGALAVANVAAVALAAAFEIPLPDSPGLLYRPGTGLTTAKVGLELVLAALAVAGAVLHWRSWREARDRTALRLAAALGLVVLSELSFATFASVYDVYNLAGHAYALLSAAVMFDGLFVTAIIDPYRRLDFTSRDLAASNARLDALRAHVEGELATTIARLREASASEQLARAELEAAIAAVPDGIAICSPEGRILRTNGAADRLLGSDGDLEETLLERWSRLRVQTTEGKPFSVEDSPVVKALQGETVPGVPASLETAGGKRLWVSIGAAPMRTTDGRLDGAVASITDIGAVQELQGQREDLLRAVSHDLRNPLQIVVLQAERLQRLLPEGPALQKERTSADRIVHAAKHMAIMIRDLVEAARMESGGLKLSLQEVEVGPFVQRLLAQSAGALDTARVRLEIAPEMPRASADPARLERILVNLIGNALKYSPQGAEVRVAAAARDGEIVVSVSDGGPGIDPEDLPRLFDRFYRGRRTQGADGLGLGLYIVQMLVEAHRGRVWVESRPGEGATFRFTLPAV